MNENDKAAIDAARLLKQFCRNHVGCADCPFWSEERCIDERCIFFDTSPSTWTVPVFRRFNSRDYQFAKVLKLCGFTTIHRGCGNQHAYLYCISDSRKDKMRISVGGLFSGLPAGRHVSLDEVIKEGET